MSKALEMPEKIPLTSTAGWLLKADCISCIIDSSFAMPESTGMKSDLEGVTGNYTVKNRLKSI